MAKRKMLTKPVAAQLRKDMTEALNAGKFALNEGQTIDDVIEHVRQGIKTDVYQPGVTFDELLKRWSGATASSGDEAQPTNAEPEVDDTEAIDDLAGWVELRAKALAKVKQAEEMAEIAKQKIVERLGDKTQGTIGGKVAVTYKWADTTKFDKKKLETEHPEIVEQYTVPNPTRRMVLK